MKSLTEAREFSVARKWGEACPGSERIRSRTALAAAGSSDAEANQGETL
jgi:hypothetical protein